MTARWLAFAIWALVAAAAVFWGLRLFVSAPGAPPHALTLDTGAAPRADLSRLFGSDAPEVVETATPALSSRFRLVGVVAPRPVGQNTGVALIAVDGKPPRAYRVGNSVETGMVLQSVQVRGASLGPRGGAALLRLEVPPLPPPNMGSLPNAPRPMLSPEDQQPTAYEEPSPDRQPPGMGLGGQTE
jgi:general secretion pathway protein C